MNKKIKLAVIVEATVGGIRKHIHDLLINLDNSKFEIALIYSKLRADRTFESDLHEFNQKEINLIELDMTRNINPVADLKSLIKLIKILKNISPDIIHLHAAKAGTLGRIAAKVLRINNIVYTPHGGSFHKFNERLGFVYKFVEKLLAFSSVHFIAVSNHAKLQYKKLLNIPDDKNHLIYNGILLKTPEAINIFEMKKKYQCEENDLIVLIPAVFYEAKGHLQLLDAAKDLVKKINPKIKILLAGDGHLRKKIESKILELELENQIKVLGFVNEMHPLFSISDVVLLPSQNEVFGYVLLEAMLYSKPIFATNVDAIPELVKDRINGELFERDRLIDIFERLNYFADDKNKLEEMGNAGFKNLKEQFSLDLMVNKTEELYLKIISN